ncbi:tetratricopeptide repeat protein [Flagellimonas taeanensis]|uniref:Tetratricopeptide repeat-containing protein n=1 Tax=Flagellimonas taeanensis TaxID=1005926 RepID=A0A1M6PNG0_9FLAO|nr:MULTISPECIES: tetratricopeptide repeat protein [Allomuricauda]MDC6385155.1 tetratricopeptide repeat protein [Muricauda sp. SK9]RIV52762.1 tetratricopeptide repeat protein [Allomuricauda taeanensis]SFB67308.1 Tetratricopeptide repeat-containing protein [Allomuricauda taeanensis]SHK09485.1 Tetratricopeptide repeat-containing protein [Allomuricauda taeanensis]
MKKFFGFGYVMALALVLIHSVGFAQQTNHTVSNIRRPDSTFYALQKRLEESKEQPRFPIKIAEAHLQLGEYYHSFGLYTEAMAEYNKALEELGTGFSDELFIVLNNNIGKVYLSLNNFELAEQHFEETRKSSIQLKNDKGLAISLGLLGASHEKQGEYEEALKDQEESLSLFEKLGNEHGVAITNENIGSIYEDLEKFDLAHKFFMRAYEYLKGSGKAEEINVLNNLGDAFRKTGDYPSALEKTSMALEAAKQLNDLHQLESAHKDLSKTYALMGDYEKAHAHLLQAEEFNSAMLRSQNTDQLNVLQTIYETNKKEVEIQLLKEQNKVSVANQNLLWVALFAIVAILTIGYNYLGRKRKATLKIQEYKQRMLKAELEKKAIEEKNLQDEIQLKTASLSRYSLHLSQKNKILLDLANTLRNIAARKNMDASRKIKELVKEIDFNLQQEQEWDEFMVFFKEIHPEFIKKLSSLSENSLSPAELRLGMLLRLNLSSKEIASILRVTPDSVRVARHRLRKKLPIDQKEELVNFMIDL